jgi:hypothetical protein
MDRALLLRATLIVPLLAAPGRAPDPIVELSGAVGSRTPFVSVSPQGTTLASWLEPAGERRWALRVASRVGGRWTPARTVAESEQFFVNWADFPSVIELADGAWLAHWLEKTATKSYAYHVRTSMSRDRGATWSAPVSPHSDTSSTEHGFVSMSPRPGGGADVVWLDGRAFDEANRTGSMRIYAGGIEPDGKPSPETVLDPKTCECCQTAMARTDAGLVAAYRDRSDGEIRDIAVVRQVNGRWTEPTIVHADNWEFRACPVNGPQLAASGRRVALAWYSAPGGKPSVQLAMSGDAGATFARPIRIDDGNPVGRVEVESLPGGSVVVFWLEIEGDAGEWRAKRVAPNGRVVERWTIAATTRTRDAGFLRAASSPSGMFVAWTASGEGGGIRVARQPVGADR